MSIIVLWLSRWAASVSWTERHSFGLFFGTVTGAMVVSFAGFIGGATMDIVFKAITNTIAFVLIIRLGRTVSRRSISTADGSLQEHHSRLADLQT
jgi:hypothetical protein